MDVNTTLRASLWRYLLLHPWQGVLAILGITLGVAVTVAVDLANSSAQKAFHLSIESVSGPATHQIVGGPAGLDEAIYTRLRVQTGLRTTAPVVEAFGSAGGQALRLLGVDPLAGAGLGDRLADLGDGGVRTLLAEPDTAMAAPGTADSLGVEVGQTFELEVGGRIRQLRLAGLLEPPGDRPAVALEGILITDIATAQELTGYIGKLSWIDVRLPRDESRAHIKARIEKLLPPEARLIPARARAGALEQMTRAFRTNLSAMGLLALVVGMFLIYNTMTFAVLQRRALIGSLRILGATRGQIFALVGTEAAIIGAVGTILGLVTGVALAQGLVHLVTRTINDLYFVLTVTDLLITPAPLIKGALLGLGATALAGLVPALEAARTTPREALHRAALEARAHRLVPRLALLGTGLGLAALAVLAWSERALLAGFIALFMLILGFALLSPLAVAGMTRAASTLVRPFTGVQTQLAIRGIYASLSRTGVAIAALMLAVATTVGVGVMVDSFRNSVDQWLQHRLQADVYVRAPTLMSSRTRSALEPRLVERIRQLPGAAEVTTSRHVSVESDRGLHEIDAIDMPHQRARRYRLKSGNPTSVWDAFFDNRGVLVSEPYAFHHRVDPGQRIELRTDRGLQSLRVLGVYYDYGSDQGVVLMNRGLYNRYFDDRGVSSMGIYLTGDARSDTVVEAVRSAAAGLDAPVEVRPSAEIRQRSLIVFDQTFAITNVLRLLAVIVAFVGILSAFMALQLERTKELAVLRATGFTRRQVGGMVTLQTGLMGLAAGVLALPTGLVLALVLIHVINQRSFGWTMETLVSGPVLLQALVLAVAAAVFAGLYPGWRMARTPPAQALREE